MVDMFNCSSGTPGRIAHTGTGLRRRTRLQKITSERIVHVSSTSADQIQLQLVSSISDIGQGSWNACLEPGANPFLSYEFLHALEESKSACARTGWLPQHVLITAAQGDSSETLAVCPMYLKGHSYGEYVFDSGWAQSYDYNVPTGPRYYPKLQCCVPFTPVEGNRILLNNNHSRGLHQEDLFVSIADTMMTLPERMGVSSVHVTFNSKEESDTMARRGWIQRTGVQYHFQNRGYDNFDDFLMNLKQKKRKSIRQERKRVQNNVVVKQLTGDDLNARVWDSFYSFYLSTVDKRWGTAYLTREFFDMIGESMRDRILLVCAYENQTDETPIAAALNLIGNDTLFGRNWGCLPGLHIHGLHFELCYYQAIDFAIRNGLKTVQAGAQGEHKIQRGYLPSTTYSNHYVANAQFAHAVKDFCQRESRELEAYSEALQVYESPYK